MTEGILHCCVNSFPVLVSRSCMYAHDNGAMFIV